MSIKRIRILARLTSLKTILGVGKRLAARLNGSPAPSAAWSRPDPACLPFATRRTHPSSSGALRRAAAGGAFAAQRRAIGCYQSARRPGCHHPYACPPSRPDSLLEQSWQWHQPKAAHELGSKLASTTVAADGARGAEGPTAAAVRPCSRHSAAPPPRHRPWPP